MAKETSLKLKYDVPSWILQGDGEQDATDEQIDAASDRSHANLAWFMRSDRERFDLDEVAELLEMEPDDVPDRVGKPDAGGCYSREQILVVAPGVWEQEAIAVARKCFEPEPVRADAAQLDAIRQFFTNPQDSYTPDEYGPIFGGEAPWALTDEGDAGRDRVADFMRGEVSPITIAAALGKDVPDDLRPVRLTVTLPAWQAEKLAAVAHERGEGISDALAMNLYWAASGTPGDDLTLDDAPNYAALLAH